MPRGRSVQADERQVKTLTLRRAGWRFEDIASELGYADPSGARYAYASAMAKARGEPAAELRDLHHERLEDLWRRAYQIALTDPNPDRALRAMERCVLLLDRDARLLGLDAPSRSVVNVITEDVVDAEIARLEAAVAARARSEA